MLQMFTLQTQIFSVALSKLISVSKNNRYVTVQFVPFHFESDHLNLDKAVVAVITWRIIIE